jgi:hypothetical protein
MTESVATPAPASAVGPSASAVGPPASAVGPSASAVGERAVVAHVLEVLRDVARGGIAGIVVGVVVAGLGGRLVMRLATILHEDAVGLRTENGELIGAITLNGTLALLFFGGLGMGLMAGVIWVIAGPWIPGRGLGRALVTAVAAIALGTPPLVQRTNSDFFILDHDPVVVALLIGLVGLVGFSLALVDGALDRRLPRPTRLGAGSTVAYAVIALLGLVLILPVVVSILLTQHDYDAPIRAGFALAVVGVCTLAWWILRARGQSEPPRPLRMVASLALLVAVVLGGATGLPHIIGAAGLS